MTQQAVPAATVAGTAVPPTGLRWALWGLCLTEIVSWGVLYYGFPVLAPAIRQDTGWSTTTLTAVFSAALAVSGIVGIWVGHVIHRHGPRWVMTVGSVLAAASLPVIASAHSLWVYAAGWLLAGVAMAGVLYAPAFAAVTVWFGEHRVRALTMVTLVAGLASTVFAPVTAVLEEHLGWRDTYLVLAAVLALITIPVHALALRPAWPEHPPEEHLAGPATRPVKWVDFWVIAAGFTAAHLASLAVVVNLVPMLTDRGYTATQAAWALGIGGIGQVLGRLGYARLNRHTSLVQRTAGVFGVIAVTTALFALVPTPFAAVVLIALVAGNARGLATLLSATAISDRWGAGRYARLNGLFGAPIMVASALAPFAGAGLAAVLGGYPAAFLVLALLALAGAVAAARP